MLMNTPRLMERMKTDGMDAIVATAPENVTYTSGFWAMSQWIRRGPQAYVLTPAEGRGEQAVIASTGTLDLIADQDVPVEDVRRYGYFAIETDALCVDHDERDIRVSRMLEREDPGLLGISIGPEARIGGRNYVSLGRLSKPDARKPLKYQIRGPGREGLERKAY